MRTAFSIIVLLGCMGLCAGATPKSYQKGKLLDIQTDGRVLGVGTGANSVAVSYNGYFVRVQIADLILVGDYDRKVPDEFVVGDDVEVRLDGNHMYLRKKDGGEWKVRVVQRRKANTPEPTQYPGR